MQIQDKFRDPILVKNLLSLIETKLTRSWKIMEICGGQTHAIMQSGINTLLSSQIELLHGPGCPVCVTSLELIDHAIEIAKLPNLIFTSFGDMLRVPGSSEDLLTIRANGGDVRVVYSPLDAVKIAKENPHKEVVFFGVGFETTVPAIAMSILHAHKQNIQNFSIIPANVLVPPAMHAILSNPENKVDAFLAAGHVCAIMGYWQYESIAEQYHCPIVVTGFEPIDLVSGILLATQQLENDKHSVENTYKRVVTKAGNDAAQALITKVFEPVDRKWRGIGIIPSSGLGLKEPYSKFDASVRFNIQPLQVSESKVCIAGQILQGLKKPFDCPAFAKECTPQNPLGAPMVSAEGTCAAYFRYNQKGLNEAPAE